MKMLSNLKVLTLSALLAFGVAACSESDKESAKDDVKEAWNDSVDATKDAAEDAKDAVGDFADDTQDAAEDLKDDAADAMQDTGNEIEDLCEDAKESANAKDTDC